jgi:hypothetical protein
MLDQAALGMHSTKASAIYTAQFNSSFDQVWNAYPEHSLANWGSDLWVFETHIRPMLLGPQNVPPPSAAIVLQTIVANPIITSDDVWGAGIEIWQNERRSRAR